MKRILPALLVTLVAGGARAEMAYEPYAPYKLVGSMPETEQVLLWDESEAQFAVARTGDDVGGWTVVKIDVTTPGGPRVLLEDETSKVRDELRLTRLPRPGAIVFMGAERPAAPVPQIAEQLARTINRAELERQLGDFEQLSVSMKLGAVQGGGFRFIKLDPQSWLASLGFREGDVVRRIAGDTVSSVDDASKVYVRLRAIQLIPVVLERDGRQVALRIDIR